MVPFRQAIHHIFRLDIRRRFRPIFRPQKGRIYRQKHKYLIIRKYPSISNHLDTVISDYFRPSRSCNFFSSAGSGKILLGTAFIIWLFLKACLYNRLILKFLKSSLCLYYIKIQTRLLMVSMYDVFFRKNVISYE